jgi:hypothetical protein
MSDYENPQRATDAGGEALRHANSFPWYDSRKDDFQLVATPEKPSSMHGLPLDMSPLVFFTAVVVLVIVLAALIVAIVRAVKFRKRKASDQATPVPIGEAERIEALPFPVARGPLSLLDQARQFYQSGNYAGAMIYLFSHQLVQLDRRQIIRLAKGKTNRQYLRELGRARTLRHLVGQTLVGFEDVFFGHHGIDRQRFEACWSRLPEFESLLAQGNL